MIKGGKFFLSSNDMVIFKLTQNTMVTDKARCTTLVICFSDQVGTLVAMHWLVSRPRSAFHRLQYGKAGEGLVYFLR